MLLSPGSGSNIKKRREELKKDEWGQRARLAPSVLENMFSGDFSNGHSRFWDEAQKGALKSEVIKENLPGTIHNLPTKQPVILTAIYEERIHFKVS